MLYSVPGYLNSGINNGKFPINACDKWVTWAVFGFKTVS